MIPFIKRFSYLHLKNLDDLQPDETEVKGIVPSPRYNLRARAGGIFPSPPTAVPTEIQQNFSDGFSFPTPCFLFLRYGAVAMRLGTHKFFGLKLLEEDRALLLGEFGSVGLGLACEYRMFPLLAKLSPQSVIETAAWPVMMIFQMGSTLTCQMG
ncbi:hypothetical protein TNCV_3260301 [Trichonephila clavipes]|nr:hypothetical protein TNCV_3260301 [Trichonephila clavipes]